MEKIKEAILLNTGKTRSLSAIKKKSKELIKIKEGRADKPAKKVNVWTKEETNLLLIKYEEAEGPNITSRINNIILYFPGRSQKALMTRLRDGFPEIYYKKAKVSDIIQTSINQEGENANLNVSIISQSDVSQQINNTYTQSEVLTQTSQSIENNNNSHNNATLKESPPTTNLEISKAIEKNFETIYARALKQIQKPRIKRINTNRFDYQQIVDKIDFLLQQKVYKINNSKQNISCLRLHIKTAIYTAGFLLSKMSNKVEHSKLPNYIYTRNKIIKMKKRIQIAKNLKSWDKTKKFDSKLKEMSIKMKKLKMTPTDYIKINHEKIEALKVQEQYQRAKAETQGIKYKFLDKPALRTITPSDKNNRKLPEINKTAELYKNLYSKNLEEDRKDSPIFNKWINKISKCKKSTLIDEHHNNQDIEKIIEEVIKRSSPWKATGYDGIPNAFYKTFNTAKKLLIKFILDTLNNNYCLQENDVRAKIILLYKKGDADDPVNYRPIALLNSDYKLLTATISKYFTINLPTWMISKEQLARQDIWGIIHGLLWDKGCTQAARLSRCKNYSLWYDFTKAYDSVSHKRIRKLLGALPVNKGIINTIKASINKWSVVIDLGKTKTSPIYVRRGIYQGDSLSPLLFILITAGIIDHINKLSKGKQEITAFMDDIKIHVPSKSAAEITTKEVATAAEEIGLKLNIKKCGFYNHINIQNSFS